MRVYVETSAANYLMNTVNGEGAEATRTLQLSKGREWYSSTTVLWELMQIREREELDACMYLASCLFSENLLMSAAEIMLDYIEQGMPSYQRIEPFTKSEIGKYWKRACKDKSFCFFMDSEGFKNATTLLKSLSRYVAYITHDTVRENIDVDAEFVEDFSKFVDAAYGNYFCADSVDATVKWLRKTAILVVFLQICLCMDVSKDVIEEFWSSRKIKDPVDRLDYLLEEFPDLVRRGPAWNIANAILIQCSMTGRSSRGAFHDGLHAIYLPFIDAFLTRDEHFRHMRNAAKKPMKGLYNKILHMDECGLVKVDFV